MAQSTSGHAPSGWLWYRDPSVAPKPKPPTPPKARPAQGAGTAGPATWSTAWIRATLPRLLDQAVQNPTPDNVRAYLALQKLSVNRAQNYAEMAKMVTQSDASLDENTRYPSASAAAQATTERAQQGLVSGLQALSKSAGLFFFFRSDCPYCHRDLSVLRTLQLMTGIKIIAVSLDGAGIDDSLFPRYLIDNGQAARLGIRATPAFFLVRPPNMSDVVEIGQGYLSLDELETRIIEQAYYRHWINTNLYAPTRLAPPIYSASATPGNPGDIGTADIAAIQSAVSHLPPPGASGTPVSTLQESSR